MYVLRKETDWAFQQLYEARELNETEQEEIKRRVFRFKAASNEIAAAVVELDALSVLLLYSHKLEVMQVSTTVHLPGETYALRNETKTL